MLMPNNSRLHLPFPQCYYTSWFQMANRMITQELQTISTSGKIKDGYLNLKDLDKNERVLMDKYMEYKVSILYFGLKWPVVDRNWLESLET
jgi:hypothetical protein